VNITIAAILDHPPVRPDETDIMDSLCHLGDIRIKSLHADDRALHLTVEVSRYGEIGECFEDEYNEAGRIEAELDRVYGVRDLQVIEFTADERGEEADRPTLASQNRGICRRRV